MCFDFLCKFFVKNSYSKNNSANYCHIAHRTSCKATVNIVKCLSNLSIQDESSINPQVSNFAKNGPVGGEWFHVDTQTDRRTSRHDRANSRFSQFLLQSLKAVIIQSHAVCTEWIRETVTTFGLITNTVIVQNAIYCYLYITMLICFPVAN